MPFNGSGPSGKQLVRPLRPERALAVAALAAVLFLEPFLGIFDKGGKATVLGVPLLFAYLFVGWSLIVLLTALVMEPRTGHPEREAEKMPAGTTSAASSSEPPNRTGSA